MVCEHLKVLDDELSAAGVTVVYRDERPWSQNCRRWTRYACCMDLAALRVRLGLADCVSDHVHRDHWTGEERGFVCDKCYDAVIGDYEAIEGRPVVK